MKYRWSTPVALVLSWSAIFLLCALIAELYLRYEHSRYREGLEKRLPTRHLCTWAAEDPELVYELIPGRCGANSLGFPDREHDVSKPPGTYRVAFVGDSVAAGHLVEPGKGFANIFEDLLNERALGKEIESLIFARPGYNTRQELILLNTYVERFHPDLIVWSYTLNDPAHPIFHNANGEAGRYFYRPTSFLLNYLEGKYLVLQERLRDRDCDGEYHAWLHCVYQSDVAAHFEQFGSFSRQHGIPIVLVINPIITDFAKYPYDDLHQELANYAKANGVSVIDFLDVFRDLDVRTVQISEEDRLHPNELGHLLLGEYLADILEPEIM